MSVKTHSRCGWMGERSASRTLRLSEAGAGFGKGMVVVLAGDEGEEVGRGQMPEGLIFRVK